MTLAFLAALVVLAAACSGLRRRRTARSIYALAALLFLGVGCGVLPAWLLDNLQSDHAIQPAGAWAQRNAIVVLGGDTQRIAATGAVEPGATAQARIVSAATLQRDCRRTGAQCKIIVSGGDARCTGAADALVYRNALLALGLEGADVLVEPHSTSTWQHAQLTSDVLRHFAADHVVLVSSGLHLRRSQLFFSHFGVEATQMRADHLCALPSTLPLAHNFRVADLALHEYLGIARYHARVAVGELPRSRG